MSTDKILQKIKIQIGGISESLQVFAEETIHPTVSDCDILRSQMNELLEELSVYKYHMQNAELSPSFQLHAKVSEKIPAAEEPKPAAPPAPEKEPEPIKPPAVPEPVKIEVPAPEIKKEESPAPINPAPDKAPVRAALAIGINDKFRFINELFTQNSSEYNIALEQLNSLQTWSDTELYLNSLKAVYDWKDSSESVKYFFTLARKRFDA